MTALSDMSDAGSRVLGMLTTPEVAVRLKCSQRKVRRLADAGELVREEFGQLVRITPESVAACERRRDAP